jgi:hypothetical protein
VGTELRGVAVHYTGAGRLGALCTAVQSAQRLETERVFHTGPEPKGRGWSDIAYNYAIDQAGRVFELRGMQHRSAANGDEAVNRTHGAVLFLVGALDVPSLAAIEALTQWRRTLWLKAWPAATAVVGHHDLHATECPGTALSALVKAGRWNPPEDSMALSDDDVDRIAERVVDRLLAAPGSKTATATAKYVAVAPDGRKLPVTDALTELLRLADR